MIKKPMHAIGSLPVALVLVAVACSGTTPVTPQPTYTPYPTNTPYPTQVPPTVTAEPTSAPQPTSRPYCDGQDVARWLAIVKPPVDGLGRVAGSFSSTAEAEAVQDSTPYLTRAKQWEYAIANSDPPPCAQAADSYLVTTFGDWRVFWEDVGAGDFPTATDKLNEAVTALGLATPEIKTLSALIGTTP